MLQEVKPKVCQLGLGQGRLVEAAPEPWAEERKGDEELAAGSVDNSKVFLWQSCEAQP